MPPGVFLLTRPGHDPNGITGNLVITGDLTIEGAGSGATMIRFIYFMQKTYFLMIET